MRPFLVVRGLRTVIRQAVLRGTPALAPFIGQNNPCGGVLQSWSLKLARAASCAISDCLNQEHIPSSLRFSDDGGFFSQNSTRRTCFRQQTLLFEDRGTAADECNALLLLKNTVTS